MEQTLAVINAIKIAGDLGTEESARKWMLRVAAQIDRLTVAYGDTHAARIRAVVRADQAKRLGRDRHENLRVGSETSHGDYLNRVCRGLLVQPPEEFDFA